jgi:outer membrane protein assembly factor BamB
VRRGALALLLLAASCSGDGGTEALTVAETVRITPSPGALAVSDDAVWVAASESFREGGESPRHVLVRVDAGTGKDADTGKKVDWIELATQPSDLVADDRAVWVVGTDFPDDGRPPRAVVTQVDARTNRIRRVLRLGVGALSSVALGHGSVWLTDSREDVLYRLDPETGATQAEISVSGGPTSVATDERWVWVTSPGTGKLHRVDPRTEVPGEFVLTGSVPSVVVAGPSGVWVSNYGDENVVLVGTDTLEVEETVEFDTSASRMALAGDLLAVVEAEGRALTLLDRAEGTRSRLEDRFLVDVGLVVTPSGTQAGHRAWVVDHENDAILATDLP